MALASIFGFLLLSHLVALLHSAEDLAHTSNLTCPPFFHCSGKGPFSFPFTNITYPECGLVQLNCTDPDVPKFQLDQGPWYEVIELSGPDTIKIKDQGFQDLLKKRSCDFNNLTFPNSPSVSFTIFHNLTFFKCPKSCKYFDDPTDPYNSYKDCPDYNFYYKYSSDYSIPPNLLSYCNVIELPVEHPSDDLFDLLTAEFSLEFHVSDHCLNCHKNGGQCLNNNHEFQCSNATQENSRNLRVILGTAIPGVFVLTIGLVIFLVCRRKKWSYVYSYFLARKASSDPSSRVDLEGGSDYFGVPVFTYSELEEATKNFDPTKELGDGGFGTVYYGKLRDGREVAVKRLYEHNYKRVEQFRNEIEILTRLRHRNLVTLYGCTSRHSRELLLVYEYISNGTVADHLHGDRAENGSLTWPIRMNIAIETASALAYLHATDIIHRDVKTNNILLDNNFCVKVADFGLSRLFPNDVSHVSTAPQGTPGYVDPEYHQCYQLTDKSDVYSFGVVLIELISSLPAVDISRHRHEINLANLALNRIQRCAFNELIDQCLGFESDATVERMTTSVAELAFRCLQLEKEMRPTMDQVLEDLKAIRGDDDENEKTGEANDSVGGLKNVKPPPSPESEDVLLLKNAKLPSSPDSVTDKWVSSSSTTTSASG